MKSINYSNIIIALIISAANQGCNQPPIKDESSFFYSVPVNSTLTLNKPVTINANLARTFFQYGKIKIEKNIDIYYPHCSIVMNTLFDHDRVIQPTTFTIYRVVDDEEHAQRQVLFAALNMFSDGDGLSIIGHSTYYYLRSNSEPDVATLECVQWGSPHEVKYLSISEVRQALGEFFTLNIK